MANVKKPLAAALGAAFLATSVAPLASTAVNPFSAQPLLGGYDLTAYDKDGEGTCGGAKAEDEGSCGAGKKAATGDEAATGGEATTGGEAATGDEAASGGEAATGSKAAPEGKCAEGKCAEGKCGG